MFRTQTRHAAVRATRRAWPKTREACLQNINTPLALCELLASASEAAVLAPGGPRVPSDCLVKIEMSSSHHSPGSHHSPVRELRIRKRELEAEIARALAVQDVATVRRLKGAIAQVEAYLRSWGAKVP